ncbi:MAG: hypothetical protein GVY17_14005 [Cyanobacteria bacterium]|nr:hypothetical protein [Cyanobacteria bacterium GSL.Bin21]
MFEQFRSHFPQGSLISELIQIDHGKYIVRASVQNAGLTLATGLAAADTVEQAEDKARTRALAVLDISLSPTSSSTAASLTHKERQVSATPHRQEQSAASAQTLSANVSPSQQKTGSSQPSPISPQRMTTIAQGSTVETVEGATTVSNDEAEAEIQPASFESNGADTTSSGSSHTERGSSDDEQAIMDNSDIIARTNVELRRLNWTSEQGRKFLEETYGKRSRSLLSESELREFLQYLEKQPTPTQDSD